MFYATIRNDKLVIDVGNTSHTIETVDQFIALIGDNDSVLMCSSSIDFPADETSNQDTIALVREIFGA